MPTKNPIKPTARLRLTPESSRSFKASQEAYFASSNPSRFAAQLKDRIFKKKGMHPVLEAAFNLLPDDLKSEVEDYIMTVEFAFANSKYRDEYWYEQILPSNGLSHEVNFIYDETMRVYNRADKANKQLVLRMMKDSLEAGKFNNDPVKLEAAEYFLKEYRFKKEYKRQAAEAY